LLWDGPLALLVVEPVLGWQELFRKTLRLHLEESVGDWSIAVIELLSEASVLHLAHFLLLRGELAYQVLHLGLHFRKREFLFVEQPISKHLEHPSHHVREGLVVASFKISEVVCLTEHKLALLRQVVQDNILLLA